MLFLKNVREKKGTVKNGRVKNVTVKNGAVKYSGSIKIEGKIYEIKKCETKLY